MKKWQTPKIEKLDTKQTEFWGHGHGHGRTRSRWGRR